MRYGFRTRLGLVAAGLTTALWQAGCSDGTVPPPTPESSADNSAASAPAGPAPQRTNQDKPQGATGPKISAPTPTPAPTQDAGQTSKP